MTNATQIVVIGIFILFLIIAVIVFASFGSSSSLQDKIQAEIWGTMPSSIFSGVVNNLNATNPGTINMSYREIPRNEFESELVNALADGEGPDAVLLPSDLLAKLQRKIAIISFDVYSERDFKDNFIQGSETLLTSVGTFGLPFVADPLVMYWNRDILNSAAIAAAPTTWEQVLALSEKLTVLNSDRTVARSAVPFGDYTNVSHAKDILVTLILQSGNDLVVRNTSGALANVLADNGSFLNSPIDSALDFYTQFADPLKPVYTWNRSLPESKEAFVNGDLAFYFGPASELPELRSKNPNLNFDVASVPQPQNATVKKVGSTIYSFSILASSKHQQAALNTISLLSSSDVVKMVSDATGLPPARRDLLGSVPGTASGEVFWRSALWSYTWLDPDPVLSDAAFRSTVDAVVTGREKIRDSARTLSGKIDEIIRNGDFSNQ